MEMMFLPFAALIVATSVHVGNQHHPRMFDQFTIWGNAIASTEFPNAGKKCRGEFVQGSARFCDNDYAIRGIEKEKGAAAVDPRDERYQCGVFITGD